MPPEPQHVVVARKWLRYAEADLAVARSPLPEDALLELWGFHAQQAAEKAIKAVLISLQLEFPRSHNIEFLIGLLPPTVAQTDALAEAHILTAYATVYRYPGEVEAVIEDEYQRLLAIAEQVVSWATTAIERLS
jgi:HEPN domain-containing protein